ncbi:MAG: hypothetical protein AB8I08_10715 [Sandaracinaceae bacterium]
MTGRLGRFPVGHLRSFDERIQRHAERGNGRAVCVEDLRDAANGEGIGHLASALGQHRDHKRARGFEDVWILILE